jgi:hypothetical protein
MGANTWELLRSGRQEQALSQLRDAYSRNPDASHAMELGVALLWAEEYRPAWDHFYELAVNYPRRHDIFFAMAGTAKWCVDGPNEAARTWHDGLNCAYTDAAGGLTIPLLLFFASHRNPESYRRADATQQLSDRVESSWARNWPGPLAEFLLGRIDDAEFQSKCVGIDEDDTALRLWQARFYVGVLEYARANEGEFTESMRRTALLSNADFDPASRQFLVKLWHPEFFLARFEARE